MKIKRLMEFASASVLSLSTLLTLGMPLAHAAALTCTWTGATDLKFSTATNWNGCTGANNPGGVPVTGDIIAFGSAANSNTIYLINDLSGVTFGGVVSNVTTVFSYYKIDTISLVDGASLSTAIGTICYPQFANVEYGTLNGAGSLTIDNNNHNLYGAATTIAGNLSLSRGDFNPASGSTVSGSVTITSPVARTTATGCSTGGKGGGSASGSNFKNFTVNSLTIQNGVSTLLADVTFPLTLGGGSGTTSPRVSFYGNLDANNNYADTTYAVSGPITLLHDAVLYSNVKTTVNVTGSIIGSGFAITKDPTSTGTVTFSPSSNNSSTVAGTPTNAVKTTTVSDDQSTTYFTVVPNETLVVDGKAGFVNLIGGSKLMGSGQVNGIYSQPGSTVAPGHSPGCLTSTTNVYLAGTYQAEIGGTDPCTGYDQMKVTGTVDVTDGTLVASLFNGFVPQVGQSYTIISNDAADAVTGTFTGIAEGGTYTNQGVTYSVTYKGGDGNDVVLTVTAVDASALPKQPDTGFALVAGHPLFTMIATTLSAAAILVVARKMRPSVK